MKTPFDASPTPADARAAVLKRDGWTCQSCGHVGMSGLKATDVQVHHIVPYRLSGSHALDNLVTLCGVCHKAADRAYWTEAMRDWQRRLGYKNLTS